MKDNIPKKTLDEYYELNALEMVEVENAKQQFNKNAMNNEEQSRALLNLQIQELEMKLHEAEQEKRNFEVAYIEAKSHNEELLKRTTEFKKHLIHVINELEGFQKENASFVEKLVVKIKVCRLKKKSEILRHEVENNEA